MEKQPQKCPLCGSKITKVLNAHTNNYFYRCSNNECHFVLGADYTDVEYYLQGQTLQTECVGCGKDLTVVNGPHGLYPRCFNCDCDLTPTFYEGRTYFRWVNANCRDARDEVKALIRSFEEARANTMDQMYDFEAFIASTERPAEPESSKPISTTPSSKRRNNIGSDILSILADHPNVPMEAADIKAINNKSETSIRLRLGLLRNAGLVKVVSYRESENANFTLLFQLTESELPELRTYENGEDGYATVTSFLRNRLGKNGNIPVTSLKLSKFLKDNSIKHVVVRNNTAYSAGYPISVMEEFLDSLSSKAPKSTKKEETPSLPKRIISILNKDLSNPMSATDLNTIVGTSIETTRGALKLLRDQGTIKIVGYRKGDDSRSYPALYQLTKSPIPELTIYSKNDGYNTINSFILSHSEYGRPDKIRKALTDYLNKINYKGAPISTDHGLSMGYPTSLLESCFAPTSQVDEPIAVVEAVEEPVEKPKKANSKSYKTAVIDFLKQNLSTAYTELQVTQALNVGPYDLRAVFADLKQHKKIKVVGWDRDDRQHGGAVALKYQLLESSLPRFKTTINTALYMTLKQFYERKLSKKHVITYNKVQEMAQNLTPIPLLINQRAYAGYSVADLKETFKEYLSVETIKTRIRKKCKSSTPKITPAPVDIDVEVTPTPVDIDVEVTPAPVDIDVEAALLVTQAQESTKVVSDPLEKKSFFGSITSLFKKKEKVHP